MIQKQIPAGAEIVPEGVLFTLYSLEADAVEVCLFDSLGSTERARVSLSNDGNGSWSALVPGIRAGQLYGYRVHGPLGIDSTLPSS
jgi:glycogen operon protein